MMLMSIMIIYTASCLTWLDLKLFDYNSKTLEINEITVILYPQQVLIE